MIISKTGVNTGNSSNSNWQQIWQRIQPGQNAWKGASYSIIGGGYVLTLLTFIHAAAHWSVMDFTLIFALLFLLGVTLGGMLFLRVIKLIESFPSSFNRALFSGGLLLILVSNLLVEGLFVLMLSGYIIVVFSLIGAAVGVWLSGTHHILNRLQKGVWLVGGGVGFFGLLIFLLWLFAWTGPVYEGAIYAQSNIEHATPTHLPDPTKSGEFEVSTLFYGTGTDKRRVEYGSDVDLVSETVDGTPFIDGWSSVSGWYRTRYWGFDSTNLPLNGRVWFPNDTGPSPLVLIAHGNHNWADFSEGGYDYLGELLASRGYIVVSVDQNFLNGGPADIAGSLSEENDARAWLLLEHLRLWHAWNSDPENPFYQRVDVEHIALIGHSRGGEAAAIAAMFNTLQAFPDDANIPFNYNYGIKTVIAIAPTFDQYKPGERQTVLEGVNYLTFQGSADGDNETFMGLWQYNNTIVQPSDDTSKVAVYIHGANHNQFNSGWEANDAIGPQQYLRQDNQLMPASDQQQIAKGLISAYLDATLKHQDIYHSFFVDPSHGKTFLPDTLLISQFIDSDTMIVADFEEDVDPATTRLNGARWESTNLSMWREQPIPNKFQDSQYGSSAAYIGWKTSSHLENAPRLTLTLPDDIETDHHSSLTVALGATDVDSACETAIESHPDFHIELVDADGSTARLPLSHFGILYPQSTFAFDRLKFPLPNEERSEMVLDTFILPLGAFAEMSEDLDPSAIRSVNFVFDEPGCGGVIIDNLGFRRD